MLHNADDNFVTRLNHQFPEAEGHKVQAFRSVAGKDDFLRPTSMNQIRHLLPGRFIGVGRRQGQIVEPAEGIADSKRGAGLRLTEANALVVSGSALSAGVVQTVDLRSMKGL